MKGGNSPSRPSYPDVAARIGEDPARYLSADMDVSPRVRGIQDIGVANGWLAVARDLGVDADTIENLEQRRDYLVDQRVAADGGERRD